MMPIIYFTAIAAILFLALRMTCGACVMGVKTGAGRAGQGVRVCPSCRWVGR